MASAVTYLMFILLLGAILSTELIITQDISLLGEGMPVGDDRAGYSAFTGNIIRESAQDSSSAVIIWVVLLFIIITCFVVFKRHHLKALHTELHDSYASLILRIVLGLWFIFSGFQLDSSFAGYVFGIAEIIIGLILLLGLGTRVISYVLLFYSGTLLANPNFDQINVFLIMGICLSLIMLGAGKYSFDYEWRLEKGK